MAEIKVKGIILKLVNFGDYDRYLNVLTRDLGIISVFAKGVRRPKSRLNSLAQLFSFNEMILFENKGKYKLNDLSSVQTFKNLNSDIYLLTAAAQLAELILDNGHEIADSPRLYELLIRAFYEFDIKERDAKTVCLAAEIKLSSYWGYEPLLSRCFKCENNLAGESNIFFDFRGASVYCANDYIKFQENLNYNFQQISPALLDTLRYIVYSPLEKTFSFSLNNEIVQELEAFCNLYLLERYEKDYNKISKLDMFM